MSMVLKFKVKDFIGVEHKVLNCWQLVKKFYKEVLNIDINHIVENSRGLDPNNIEELISANSGSFTRIKSIKNAEFGDILTFTVAGIESHIGVYIGNGLFLHTTEKAGSVIDRFKTWERVSAGIFRAPKGEPQ